MISSSRSLSIIHQCQWKIPIGFPGLWVRCYPSAPDNMRSQGSGLQFSSEEKQWQQHISFYILSMSGWEGVGRTCTIKGKLCVCVVCGSCKRTDCSQKFLGDIILPLGSHTSPFLLSSIFSLLFLIPTSGCWPTRSCSLCYCG